MSHSVCTPYYHYLIWRFINSESKTSDYRIGITDVDFALLIVALYVFQPRIYVDITIFLDNKVSEQIHKESRFVVFVNLFCGGCGKNKVQIGMCEFLVLDTRGTLAARICFQFVRRRGMIVLLVSTRDKLSVCPRKSKRTIALSSGKKLCMRNPMAFNSINQRVYQTSLSCYVCKSHNQFICYLKTNRKIFSIVVCKNSQFLAKAMYLRRFFFWQAVSVRSFS